MSFRSELVKLLLKELLVESSQNIDWSDVGFTADEEARLNRFKPNFTKDIGLVALVDPTTNPMSIVAPASSAADKDPLIKLGEWAELQMTLANKTNPVFKTLMAWISTDGVNGRYMTFESPSLTDYQVPTSKVFLGLKLVANAEATANSEIGLGYGDTGVADGTTAPTTPIYLIGEDPANSRGTPYVCSTAWLPFEWLIYISVPAGKFPFLTRAALGNVTNAVVYGVEVDA